MPETPRRPSLPLSEATSADAHRHARLFRDRIRELELLSDDELSALVAPLLLPVPLLPNIRTTGG